MKFKKAFIVFFIIFCAVFVMLFELGKNTLTGWIGLAVLLVVFFISHGKTLSKKGKLIRFLSWIVFIAAAVCLMNFTGPQVKTIPAVETENPAVTQVRKVEQGELTGVITENEKVEVYAGIPFAAPPVGDLRWKEPQPPAAWDGVRKCDTFAPASMQQQTAPIMDSLMRIVAYGTYRWFDMSDNYLYPMSEDSLYLNIWKPAGDAKNLPVLFFIHGGSLTGGQTFYSEYNGESLAEKGVIVVNCAYRLNVFGYYANELLAEESPNGTTGNYGLLDQIAALKWVNENIEAFGGDPDKITIAGESAGSSSVNAVCVSPLAKGLFRYAIGESSSINAKRPYHTFRSYDRAIDMGKNIMDEFSAENLADLRSIDAEKLVNTRYTNSAMTIDGYAITEQPYTTYEKGNNNEEALLNGYNGHEADVFSFTEKVTDENYVESLEHVLGKYAKEGAELCPPEPLAKRYSLFLVEQGGNAKGSYDRIVSAAWFNYSHYNWSRLIAEQNKPVYLYYFNKENKGLAANHGGEMPFAYGNLHRHAWLYTDEDNALSETMQNYWVNFVKTGDPNGKDLPEWVPFNESPDKVMLFGDTVEMINNEYLDIYKIIDKYQND